jgi:DNA-binding MarR family transcriptional regulator
MVDNDPAASCRLGDLAEALASLPSRLTRQIRRLDGRGWSVASRALKTGGAW